MKIIYEDKLVVILKESIEKIQSDKTVGLQSSCSRPVILFYNHWDEPTTMTH